MSRFLFLVVVVVGGGLGFFRSLSGLLLLLRGFGGLVVLSGSSLDLSGFVQRLLLGIADLSVRFPHADFLALVLGNVGGGSDVGTLAQLGDAVGDLVAELGHDTETPGVPVRAGGGAGVGVVGQAQLGALGDQPQDGVGEPVDRRRLGHRGEVGVRVVGGLDEGGGGEQKSGGGNHVSDGRDKCIT